MRLLVMGLLAVAVLGLSAARAAEQDQAQTQDHWRYTFHNGEWWYWLPAGRWVYWRGGRWNDYDPKTYVSNGSSGAVSTGRRGPSSASQAAAASDIRPFYGHALSNLDRRPVQANNEVGPFYGHALPSEVFGVWRGRGSVRPFYGHATSAGD